MEKSEQIKSVFFETLLISNRNSTLTLYKKGTLMVHITKPKGVSVLGTVGTETSNTTWLPALLFSFSLMCLPL